ncbi:MAG: hypothetical protein GIX03_15235, partial [Candidatus Eremiobacteraeota bacterium]|nr:hypothetical protein [Candidatus Eremiobacteraeota bacterium]
RLPVLAGTAAGTTAGTQIQNQATATYQDASGNTYNTNSNTVTTTVQNAPSLTVTPPAPHNVAPGGTASDLYTLTNTGNGAANFSVPATPATITGGSGATITNFNFNGVTYPNTAAGISALNAALAAAPPTPVGGTITIAVSYSVPAGATTPGTVTTTLTASATQPAAGALQAVTSAPVTGTVTDNIVADARLDLQKTSTQSPTTGAITYTIAANNGGNLPAHDLLSVKALLGTAVPGILISDKIPQFPAGTPLAISGAVTVTTNAANGYVAGAAQVYYTTDTTGTSGWTLAPGGTPGANAAYIGVFLSGGAGGSELNANPGSTAGNVPAPQVTIGFTIAQPTGNGSGNAGSVKNLADSVIGGGQSPEQIIGPNIPAGTPDSASATAITTPGQGINNTTPVAPPSGASNQTTNQALGTGTVLNGPLNAPGATGSYNGVVAVTNQNDFTAIGYPAGTCTNTSATPGAPAGSLTATATGPINVPGTLQNNSNIDTTYKLVATAPTGPAGWTVQIFAANAAGAPTGTSLSGAAAATATVASINVNAGQSYNYVAVYTAPAAVQCFTPSDATVVATNNTTATDTNTTHNEVTVGGYVVLTKTQTITSSGCPAGATPAPPAGTVCPSGVIAYAIDYRDIAPSGASLGTGSVVIGGTTAAGTFKITENGTVAPNNWGTYTNGLNAAPTDTMANTIFTGGTVGSTSFVAQVGGPTFVMAPGTQGTISFNVTVK